MKKLNYFLTILFALNCVQGFSANPIHKQDSTTQKTDEDYMQIAIDLAKKNPRAPFGAVIVDNETGKILAKGLNASKINPTFHGEIVAINNCAQKHPHVDWSKVTLYTTAEPCSMCQSAVIWANIPRVVFATSIKYLASHGWDQINIPSTEVNDKSPFYNGYNNRWRSGQ